QVSGYLVTQVHANFRDHGKLAATVPAAVGRLRQQARRADRGRARHLVGDHGGAVDVDDVLHAAQAQLPLDVQHRPAAADLRLAPALAAVKPVPGAKRLEERRVEARPDGQVNQEFPDVQAVVQGQVAEAAQQVHANAAAQEGAAAQVQF